MSSTVLLIDTSENACHVALYGLQSVTDRYEVLALESQLEPRRHADILLSLIDTVLSQYDVSPESLDAIALVNGPGAFTGLRIGLAMTQGLAFGWGVPCIQVNALELWAQSAFAHNNIAQVVCLMDARMAEVYMAMYGRLSDDRLQTLQTPVCIAPAKLNLSILSQSKIEDVNPSIGFIGSGVTPYLDLLQSMALELGFSVKVMETTLCFESFGRLALAALHQGKTVQPQDLDAVYLRPAVVGAQG